MKKNIFRKSFVIGIILLFAGVNNIIGVGNNQIFHKIEIKLNWQYWDDGCDDGEGAYSYSDDLGGIAQADSDGDDLWAWIYHSYDWVCPCDVPASCYPVITIIYNS